MLVKYFLTSLHCKLRGECQSVPRRGNGFWVLWKGEMLEVVESNSANTNNVTYLLILIGGDG